MKNASCYKNTIPKYVKDPYAIWNDFPCPPPWNKQLLFKLDYRAKLPPEDGLHILLQIARRCDIPVPEMYVVPGRLAGDRYFTECNRACAGGVIATCVVFLAFMVAVVVLQFRRERHCRKRRMALDALGKHCDCSLCEADHLFRDGDCTLKRHSFSGHSGRYVKKGTISRSILSKRSAMYDETDMSSALLDNNDTYKQFPRISPDLESMKYDCHIYEELDVFNSRINEFTLLRKAFKKYCGKDIDFSLTPPSTKAKETESNKSDRCSSGSFCSRQTEVICADGKSISRICQDKSDYKRCSNTYDKSNITVGSSRTPSRCRSERFRSDEESVCKTFQETIPCNGFFVADTQFPGDTCSLTINTNKDRFSAAKDDFSDDDSDYFKLNRYSDDFFPDKRLNSNQVKSTVTIENDRIPFLRVPRAYERLTSTTSTRTETTTISDDSVDIADIPQESYNTFCTFKQTS